MKYNQQAAAQALANNPLLIDILEEQKQDIVSQFGSVELDQLTELRRQLDAVETFRQLLFNAIDEYNREAG